MSEETYKKIFSTNLNFYMNLNGKNQSDIVTDLGFNKSAVSTWCNGTRLPRMDKVEALAKYFGINRSDLIEEKQDMSEQEFNTVFSKRLRYYLNKYDITQVELAKKLGVGTTSVYNWCNGIKTPRMDKIDAMCELFQCKRSDLIEDKEESSIAINPKDERDIKKDLDSIMDKLNSGIAGPAAYDGQELDPEAADLFRDELEIALRRLKLINKEKYNPNKNKK